MTNVKIGQLLVKGDWQKALQCLLTPSQVVAVGSDLLRIIERVNIPL